MKLSFNPITSKTVWAGVLAAATILFNAYIGDGITISVVGTAIVALLGAIGLKDAIVKSGPTS